MKVLSILQPWASLVVLGHKKIETRSWNTKYRGELMIHASLGKQYRKALGHNPFTDFYDKMYVDGIMPRLAALPFGAIVGKVNIIETIPSEYVIKNDGYRIDENGTTIHDWKFSSKERAFGDFSPGRFGWLSSDFMAFKEPIPCKGQLSIWNLPAELEPFVKRQIEFYK